MNENLVLLRGRIKVHYQTVVLDVDNIIEKYERNNNEYYIRHRYNENEEEIYVDEELRKYFENNDITYEISVEDGFDSPGCSIDFMAVAFEHEGNLCLRTIVFKYM